MDDSSIVCTSFNFLIHGSLASLKSEKKKKRKTEIVLLSLEEKY